MKKMMLLASALLMGAMASAQVQINEMLINGPGADNGDEFVELRGAAGLNLDGYWFLSVEGDGTAAGSIDQAIPLTGLTLGANGLLLIRDSVNYDSIISPETTVLTQDFNPDLENSSNTYLIVQGYTGYVINANTNAGQNGPAAATDIDQNNDGIAGDVANNDGTNPTNVLPWTSVVDAVGWTDANGDWAYANQFGFNADFVLLNLNGGAGGASGNPVGDAFVRLADGTLVASDLASNTVGALFGTQFATLNGSVDAAFWTQQSITPGAANPVPEPGTIAALGLGAVALLRRRRK